MYFAEYNGVYFVEGIPTGTHILGPVKTELLSFFGNSHCKNLNDVKNKMMSAVLEAGGNAIVGFEYGQRTSFWKCLFKRDDVFWYGKGSIARIDPEHLKQQ